MRFFSTKTKTDSLVPFAEMMLGSTGKDLGIVLNSIKRRTPHKSCFDVLMGECLNSR